jgi:hypothetical protein
MGRSSHLSEIMYDDVNHHYHVITNMTGAMAKKYVCKACNKICRHYVTHVIRHVVTVWHVRHVYPQGFESSVTNATDISGPRRVLIITKKTVCSWQKTMCEHKKWCESCGFVITRNDHECYRR